MTYKIRHTGHTAHININPNENNIKCFTSRLFESLKSIDDGKLSFYVDAPAGFPLVASVEFIKDR